MNADFCFYPNRHIGRLAFFKMAMMRIRPKLSVIGPISAHGATFFNIRYE